MYSTSMQFFFEFQNDLIRFSRLNRMNDSFYPPCEGVIRSTTRVADKILYVILQWPVFIPMEKTGQLSGFESGVLVKKIKVKSEDASSTKNGSETTLKSGGPIFFDQYSEVEDFAGHSIRS